MTYRTPQEVIDAILSGDDLRTYPTSSGKVWLEDALNIIGGGGTAPFPIELIEEAHRDNYDAVLMNPPFDGRDEKEGQDNPPPASP